MNKLVSDAVEAMSDQLLFPTDVTLENDKHSVESVQQYMGKYYNNEQGKNKKKL